MAGKSHYDWSDINLPPEIDAHTSVKHDIIREYLIRYVSVLTAIPGKEYFKINLIDGFAGGGIYRDIVNQCEVPGSPIVLLNAIKEAEFLVNKDRKKHVKIIPKMYLSEKNPDTYRTLQYVLDQEGLNDPEIITSINSDFETALPKIVCDIKKGRSKKPHNIFLLDQYGYSDVTFRQINGIFKDFPEKTEVILTFAVDSLVNFLSESSKVSATLEKVGIDSVFKHPDLQSNIDIRTNRLLIEQLLFSDIASKCGGKYYTPFFLVSEKSHRAYWLVHISSHYKARDEMIQAHYSSNNTFVHHGSTGLNMMLGFNTTLEYAKAQMTLDFAFDDTNAGAVVTNSIMNDMATVIGERTLTLGDLINETCNYSPASISMYKEALFKMQEMGDVTVESYSTGNYRRSASGMDLRDIVGLPAQGKLIFI